MTRNALPRLFRLALCPGLLAAAAQLGAQTVPAEPVLPPPSTLKKLSVEELLDMVVTSVSKRPQKLIDAASAIQVITGEDIASSGATSIPEALRQASNLEVAQIDSRQWAITARGFNNLFADKMLVLIDGRSVYTPLYAGVYWDAQDTLLADVDRIEVISGPGATQWGANAVNGVINLETKSAQDTQGGLLFGGGGTELSNFAGARYGGRIGRDVYYRVYAKYTDRGDSLMPDGADANDAWRTEQAGFRTDWNAAGGNHATLQGDTYDATIGRQAGRPVRANGTNVLGRWTDQVADAADLRLQLYYDYTYRSILGSFTQRLNTYDADFQYHVHPVSGHDIVAGLGYRLVDDDITNSRAEAFLPPRSATEWFNAFAQDDIALVPDRWHVIAGSKIEHNDYSGFEFEPSVRTAWTPDPKQTVWAAISRAVRTPSRIDVDLYSPATPPYRIAGGPNVVAEKLMAYEVGYRAQLDSRIAVSIAAFYNDYDDLRSLEPLRPPSPFPVQIDSGAIGRSVGAELTADWQVAAGWRLRAGYTELRAHTEPRAGAADRDSDRSIAHDPNHQASLHLVWDPSKKWEWDADARSVSALSNQTVRGYAEMNLRLAWRPWERWEFALVGQNLLHREHVEFNNAGTQREIPRSGYGKATWRF